MITLELLLYIKIKPYIWEMEHSQLLNTVENLQRTWLTPSAGAACLASQRLSLDSAIIVELIDRLSLTYNNVLSKEPPLGIHLKENDTFISVKTIPTQFDYKNCTDHKYLNLNIDKNISELIYNTNELNNINNKYFVILVYPCTNNDIEWQIYLEELKKNTKDDLRSIDFRFSNNIPGCLYLGEFNDAKSFTLSKKSPHLILNELQKGSYFKILKKISEKMIENDQEIEFYKLQELFEDQVINELLKLNPTSTYDLIKQSILIKKFDSNGTGAKKAQILLHTVNEKNRIHYRPSIEKHSENNLFYYCEDNFNDIPIKNRKIRGFNKNDKRVANIKIVFGKKNKREEETVDF